MNRLKRIEGQVRGIENMLEKDAYCTDVLIQVSAVTSALNSFNKVLLANHVKTCVADNIRQGNDEVIDELVTLLQKLMKWRCKYKWIRNNCEIAKWMNIIYFHIDSWIYTICLKLRSS